MITEAEALAYVLERCDPLPATSVDVTSGWSAVAGCALAAPVSAAENVPPFANSALDGYAVRAADIASATPERPVRLRVVDEVAAGAVATQRVTPGCAIRIMTGAPMPDGADSVVMVEQTRRDDERGEVDIYASVTEGNAVRGVGDDVRVGDVVAPSGTLIGPSVAGVLASVNARSVTVIPAARVAVLSTGDELVDDGSPLRPGQIRESNRTMLVAMVIEAGAIPVDYGIVRDDEAALEAVLGDAARTCDAIITSGGVSMGDYDVVKAVLARIAEMRWMQIAIKPAKPFAFGTLVSGARTVPVFGLPGNPVSSLVSFELFARPGLLTMMGREATDRARVRAICDEPLRRRADGKTHYARVMASFGDDGRVHVRPVSAQGSHQLHATSQANALAIVPDGDGVAAGAEARVIVLRIA